MHRTTYVSFFLLWFTLALNFDQVEAVEVGSGWSDPWMALSMRELRFDNDNCWGGLLNKFYFFSFTYTSTFLSPPPMYLSIRPRTFGTRRAPTP
mgnify:CR=1 FL=1